MHFRLRKCTSNHCHSPATHCIMVIYLIMKSRLLDLLLSTPCSHEFSWPRRTASGSYYQVCLRCGDHYWYDWKTMQRTQLIDPGEHSTLAQPVRSRWSPRARRVGVSIKLQFRRKNSDAWIEGNITNISQSGVLFSAASEIHLPRHAALEMMFEMPKEISGQPHSEVLCDSYVVRSTPAGHGQSSIAAAILEYKFLHAQESVPASAESPLSTVELMHRRRFRSRPSRATR